MLKNPYLPGGGEGAPTAGISPSIGANITGPAAPGSPTVDGMVASITSPTSVTSSVMGNLGKTAFGPPGMAFALAPYAYEAVRSIFGFGGDGIGGPGDPDDPGDSPTGGSPGVGAGNDPEGSASDPDGSGGNGGGAGGDGGGSPGGPACCFIGSTMIKMADGTNMPIKNIARGDEVLDPFGNVNLVTQVKKTTLGSRTLVSYNSADPFMSSDHPVLSDIGWIAVSPIDENFDFPVSEAVVGDMVITSGGPQIIEEINEAQASPDLQLFDLTLDGTHMYLANGLAVHNCYNGGYISAHELSGQNPPGPDEGYVPMQAGEFVLPRNAVKALGPKRLKMLQAMTK